MSEGLENAALAPISEEDPCGPDLDMEGDAAFMNYMASMEGLLPASFFTFDRKSIDYATAFATGEALLARSQDIRLIVLLAKLSILNRDFPGFVGWVERVAWLLNNRWAEVHPRAEDGDYSNRLAQLGTLDDGPVVVLPLQYATLLETRRDGVLNYRAQMVAAGDAKPREGETLISTSAIDRMLTSIEIEALVAVAKIVDRLRAALAAIRLATQENAGFEQASQFTALAPLADKIGEFFQSALVKRDPSLAAAAPTSDDGAEQGSGSEATPSAKSPSAFETLADVEAALGAALGYFATREPSSPALLLIGQARETLGKNLYDVMRLLAPHHADAARVFVGPDGAFTVPVSSLSNISSPEISRSEPEPAPSRAAAIGIVEAVASHMRRVEPSSPAPYLLDRAKALASRDFLSLLHEVLPEDDLSSMKNGH